MDMTKVESSNIEAIGHDGIDLDVEFKHGATYRYKDVPRHVFYDFLHAESKGKFLNSEIKGNYSFSKL